MAAQQGRVDALLIAEHAQQWGQYDFSDSSIEIHDQPQAEDEELLNLAAIVAYRQGADLYTLPRQHIPDNAFVVASLRY